jgi:citrate lyase subunit beta/citryl-CoA lyase
MKMRSLLFVPGDRPERFDKAANSGADVIILDLEDSVSLSRKQAARDAVSDYLERTHRVPVFVRINPLDSEFVDGDIQAILQAPTAGIVLPKAEGAASVLRLQALLGELAIPVLPIATETPAALFQLDSFQEVGGALAGLTWGAEDLPAAIGAATSRNADGSYTAPYEMARSLTLFGAHAAGVAAIDTVFPDIRNLEALAQYARTSARDGFTGMMAIHPAQVEAINAAFTPGPDEIAWARSVVDAFAENPAAGVLELGGKMIDKPHLHQARKILQKVGT